MLPAAATSHNSNPTGIRGPDQPCQVAQQVHAAVAFLCNMLTSAAPVQNIPLDIVFEDDHLLVINKVGFQAVWQWLLACQTSR